MTDGKSCDRSGHYFKWLMNCENTEIETEEGVANQGMANKICEEEVHEALEGTKWGEAVGTDKIAVEAWKRMSNCGVQQQLLCRILNSVLKT